MLAPSTCSCSRLAGLCTPHPVFLSVKFTTHNQIYIDFLPDCLHALIKRSIIRVSAWMIKLWRDTGCQRLEPCLNLDQVKYLFSIFLILIRTVFKEINILVSWELKVTLMISAIMWILVIISRPPLNRPDGWDKSYSTSNLILIEVFLTTRELKPESIWLIFHNTAEALERLIILFRQELEQSWSHSRSGAFHSN